MTKALMLAAALGLGASGAHACEFQRSAKASQATVDPTVVASVMVPQSEPVATAEIVKAPPAVEVPAE